MEDPVYLSDEQVLSRMLKSESRQEQESYFESGLQRDFSELDRRELAIWMRDVCTAEECQPDIFPLSMMLVDQFLSCVRTQRGQLQLLGSVALLLASKLRQTRVIPAKMLVYYTNKSITMDELRTWELFVLTTLKWDLAFVTPVDFLDILVRQLKIDEEGQLICDIEDEALRLIYDCCLEFRFSLYKPSMIALACLNSAMEPLNLSHLIEQLPLAKHQYQPPAQAQQPQSQSPQPQQSHSPPQQPQQSCQQQQQLKPSCKSPYQHSCPESAQSLLSSPCK